MFSKDILYVCNYFILINKKQTNQNNILDLFLWLALSLVLYT